MSQRSWNRLISLYQRINGTFVDMLASYADPYLYHCIPNYRIGQSEINIFWLYLSCCGESVNNLAIWRTSSSLLWCNKETNQLQDRSISTLLHRYYLHFDLGSMYLTLWKRPDVVYNLYSSSCNGFDQMYFSVYFYTVFSRQK